VVSVVQGEKDVLAAVLRAHGRVRVPLVGECIGLALTLVCLWPALRWFGLVGGQIVSLVAYVATGATMVVGWRWSRGRPVAVSAVLR
jgi:hypothetical protein